MTWPAGKVCDSCFNAGFVTVNGAPIRCPECGGESNQARDSKATVLAWIARDHADIARTREANDLPPLGERSVNLLADHALAPPPEGFAKSGVAVPTTVTEEQRERAKARLAAGVRAIAAKGQGT